jgi:hypothetical protein
MQKELTKQEKINLNIKNHFLDLFSKKGYTKENKFDLQVWFLKFFDENFDPKEFINRVMSVTPTENSDIVKNIIMKIYLKSTSKVLSIKVEHFVDEIVENYINFKNEHFRILKLIREYDSFETKSKLEYFINNNLKLNYEEEFTSNFKVYLTEVKNIPKADLQVSLMASFSNLSTISFKKKNKKDSMNNFLSQKDPKTEITREYRLNHILKNGDFNKIDFTYDNEYSFPNIEFYAFENIDQLKKYDSGTNFLYFYLKVENLGNEYADVILSEKKPFLDIFISNIKNIAINPFEKNRTFPIDLKMSNDYYNMEFELKAIIELDRNTQASIFNKIVGILKNIISFKIMIDEKIKTIYDYFPEIAKEIDDEYNEKESKGCIMF